MDQENDNNKYISLVEATKFCSHSQEYLSLRARQGKLKAVKFGRNWVTTREWLKEYIGKVDEFKLKLYGEEIEKPEIVAKPVPEIIAEKPELIPEEKEKLIPIPPEDLPVEKWCQPANLPALRRLIAIKEFFKICQPRVAFAASLAFILLVAGITFGKISLLNVFEGLSIKAIEISQEVDKEIVELSQALNVFKRTEQLTKPYKEGVSQIKDLMVEGLARSFGIVGTGVSGSVLKVSQAGKTIFETLADSSSAFKDFVNWLDKSIRSFFTQGRKNFNERTRNYFCWLKEGAELFGQGTTRAFKGVAKDIKRLGRRIAGGYVALNDFIEEQIYKGYKSLTQLFKKKEKEEKPPEEELIPKPAKKEGLVVIPSTEKDEEAKKKIKEAFSDEVKVEIKDEISGIITPVFREREGEPYLYILVPIQQD